MFSRTFDHPSGINLPDDNAGDTHFSSWLEPSCGIPFKVSGLILENDRSLEKCRNESGGRKDDILFLSLFLFSRIARRRERNSREIRESILINCFFVIF